MNTLKDNSCFNKASLSRHLPPTNLQSDRARETLQTKKESGDGCDVLVWIDYGVGSKHNANAFIEKAPPAGLCATTSQFVIPVGKLRVIT